MEEKIAIVIPAYKFRFLRQTLDSIVVQTCRSFTVYIGDDASPQNLKEIVSDYADKMNIVYRRFDTNLGGVDLPGHWDRCIALAKEPVVWFFSDDDLMCVLFKALDFGIDVSIQAATKYLVGHSDAMIGTAVCNARCWEQSCSSFLYIGSRSLR